MTGTFLWQCLREITPPILARCARPLARKAGVLRRKSPRPYGVAATAEEEDGHFRRMQPFYQKHYSNSPYYFLWCIVVDRLLRRMEQPILEIGCGAGQLARFLCDKGVDSYYGTDFSVEAIAMARSSCPRYTFFVRDLCKPGALEGIPYKTVIAIEVLEHLEDDLGTLTQIRAGTAVLGSVPSFPASCHVRHFSGCEEVTRRYKSLFEDFRVDSFALSDALSSKRNWFFVFEGVRRGEM